MKPGRAEVDLLLVPSELGVLSGQEGHSLNPKSYVKRGTKKGPPPMPHAVAIAPNCGQNKDLLGIAGLRAMQGASWKIL